MSVSEEKVTSIREKLLQWFRGTARDLPWRRTRDPYRIWLSEIMLQQTRVDQARPYYDRFVDRYPDVQALAAADLDEVLRDWEGLGYYARARNMHRAAQIVVRERGGQFPTDRMQMLALPGVGEYTANAVLSIANGQRLAVVDGNVARVLSRLFEVEDDPETTNRRRKLQRLADTLIDEAEPGSFNEAMMELGATVCTPAGPHCHACPVRDECLAFANDSVDRYPPVRRKVSVPVYEVAAAVIFDQDHRVYIQRRAENGLLGGLWEFPGGKIEKGESAREACLREVREEIGLSVVVEKELAVVRHAYSHFKVIIFPFICSASGGAPRTDLAHAWISPADLGQVAMPGATRKIIRQLEHAE